MKTLTLDIEDSFYPHLKVILDKFAETGQVNYLNSPIVEFENEKKTIEAGKASLAKDRDRFKTYDSVMQKAQESKDSLEPEKQFAKLIEELVHEHVKEMANGTKELNEKLSSLTITDKQILELLEDLSITTNSPAVKEALEFSPQQMKQLHKAIYNPLTKYIDEAKKELTADLEDGVNHIVRSASGLAQKIVDIVGDHKKELSDKLGDISVEIKKGKSGRTLI